MVWSQGSHGLVNKLGNRSSHTTGGSGRHMCLNLDLPHAGWPALPLGGVKQLAQASSRCWAGAAAPQLFSLSSPAIPLCLKAESCGLHGLSWCPQVWWEETVPLPVLKYDSMSSPTGLGTQSEGGAPDRKMSWNVSHCYLSHCSHSTRSVSSIHSKTQFHYQSKTREENDFGGGRDFEDGGRYPLLSAHFAFEIKSLCFLCV